MKKSIADIARKRREYVNYEFGRKVAGSHMSNRNKSKLMRSLWKEAKKKYK